MISILCSCDAGNDVVREFKLEKFDRIEFMDSFQVTFHRSNEYRIIATGSEKFTENLRVIEDGDSVVVSNDARAAWLSPESNKVHLDVYGDSLVQIKASESCEITTKETLRSKNLVLIVSSKLNIVDIDVDCTVFGYYNIFPCSGVMTFSGRTGHLNIWNHALMEVKAQNLVARNAFVENKAGSDCTISVQNSLQYSILNRGNIILNGQPDLIEELNGSGEGELITIP